MEALWSLEDKWKVSTQKAIALFACTCFLVTGVCIAAVVALRRRKSGSVHQEPCKDGGELRLDQGQCSVMESCGELRLDPGQCSIMESVRWSRWEASLSVSQREAPVSLLAKSQNSTSAVWQRPILMGEKCELPRFSGLILYDHKGMPLHQFGQGLIHTQQNKEAGQP